MSKKFAEYLWLDGTVPTQQLRSKTRVIEGNKNISINDFSICGGVAANKYLNTELRKFIASKDLNFYQVPLSLCTDNAAMIGWNAIEIMKARKIKLNNYNVRPTPNILIHEHF